MTQETTEKYIMNGNDESKTLLRGKKLKALGFHLRQRAKAHKDKNESAQFHFINLVSIW